VGQTDECAPLATLVGHSDKIFGTTMIAAVHAANVNENVEIEVEPDGESEAKQSVASNRRKRAPMQLVSYAADNTIRIWDLERATMPNGVNSDEVTPLQTITGHTDWVIGCSSLRQRGLNKRLLLSWSRDGNIRVWDLDADSRPVTKDQPAFVELLAHRGPVKGTRLSKSNNLLFTWGQEDNALLLWNMSNVTQPFRPLLRKQPIPVKKPLFTTSEFFSSSRSEISSIRTPFATRVPLVGHRSPVNKVTVFSDESRLISSCSFTVIVWDLRVRPLPSRLWSATFDHTITAIIPTLTSSESKTESVQPKTEQNRNRLKVSKTHNEPGLEQELVHVLLGHADGQVTQFSLRSDSEKS